MLKKNNLNPYKHKIKISILLKLKSVINCSNKVYKE